MSVWSIALTFFLVANPIGLIPTLLALVKDFDFAKQQAILFRESLFSFFIAMAFLFAGEPFMKTLMIPQYAMSISGGMLLFIVAIRMIFPPESDLSRKGLPQEPFIVPIATPMISGGGIMTTLLIYAKREQNLPKILLASFIAWFFVIVVVMSGTYLQKILGKRGLLAMEQLMGMLLSMLSMEIVVKGFHMFYDVLQQAPQGIVN